MLTDDILSTTLETGIDPGNPDIFKIFLDDLQGNILKGHGRDYSVHLLLRFKATPAEVAAWLEGFTKQYVKSAAQQWQETARYKAERLSGGVWANCLLSCQGYEYLGIPPFKIPTDKPFRLGIKNPDIAQTLGDPSASQWENGFQGDIHALLLLADDDSQHLQNVVSGIADTLEQIADIIQRDDGFILRNAAGQVIEHFGFVDGISQPLFMKSDIDAAKEKDGGFDQWDPRASLDIIVTKDPNGLTEDSFGSYLVYRKLEQNVKKFHTSQQALAQTLGVDNGLAGAMMMGRFQDGSPVVLSDTPIPDNPTTNNFNYDADTAANKCPFHSHLRKTNPRGDTGRVVSSDDVAQALAMEKKHRIARRAVSYGNADLTAAPETGSGLLFLCFQANIENQFNFIQASWSNSANFVKVAVGPDPVIGQPQGTQQWPSQWGAPTREAVSMPLCITLQGGEYFFAPSISFLANLTSLLS
ncbi:Dyp-type peroxidase [Methylovulum psychrotolerans]|uniref:Dyp-type peroxidase n=1 Tax=Methylovulum psychrotolerans TaxID=1704499 RepID=UPI001BFFA9B0|nr:Dyp-type peroxidase [Methylovulum psychrotolerans]MBT9099721.1 Dyp-type peroxidase [Methylovulum psychrotolerans]